MKKYYKIFKRIIKIKKDNENTYRYQKKLSTTKRQLETTPYVLMAFIIAFVTAAFPPVLLAEQVNGINQVLRVAPMLTFLLLHVPESPPLCHRIKLYCLVFILNKYRINLSTPEKYG